jgi:hypothetical protein
MNLDQTAGIQAIIHCVRKVAVHLVVWVAISRRHTVGPRTSLPTHFISAQQLSEHTVVWTENFKIHADFHLCPFVLAFVFNPYKFVHIHETFDP